MTIGKRMYQWALMILISALLVSCGVANSDELPLELLGESLPSTEPAGDTEETPSAYCVTVPSDCSASLRECADFLAASIARQTGVRAWCLYETERSTEEEGFFFIYLGWVRSSSLAHREMKGLKIGDYLCLRMRNEIVLGGKSDEATVAAVDRFCRQILPSATESMLMQPNGGFSYTATGYGVDTVRLNGFDLHEYCLAYPTDASVALRSLAYALRDEIARQSGYVLAVLPEHESHLLGKRIFLRVDGSLPAESSAYWIPLEDGVSLTASDFFGVSVAADQFCRRLFSEGFDEACAVTVEATRAFLYHHQLYTLGSLMVADLLPFPSADEVIQLTNPILSDSPHAVLCDAPLTDRVTRLTESLDAYTPLAISADGASAVLAYGRDGVLSLLDCREIEGTSLRVALFWVGDEWSGFSVLQISGTLSEDCAVRLSDLCSDGTIPSVVLIHTDGEGGTLSIADADSAKLHAVYTEEATVDGNRYVFSCYATTDTVRVAMKDGASAGRYGSLTVERISAF